MKKLSRSKIELFFSCPRCFWLDCKHNLKRPEEFSGGWLGQKYDPILKQEFDHYRKTNRRPAEIPENFTLYTDFAKLKVWRQRGIEIKHRSGLIVYGKIDDLLLDENGHLVPFDFKVSLSPEFKIYQSYRRQLEIYGYLLQKAGESVAKQGALYVVKVSVTLEKYLTEERFCQILEPLVLETYDQVLEEITSVLSKEKPPEPNENCSYCQWLEESKKILR